MTAPAIFFGATVLSLAVAVFIATVCRSAYSAPAGIGIAIFSAAVMLAFAVGMS